MCLKKVTVRPVLKPEERRFGSLMQKHHYLGFVPKMGHTIWYVATLENQWVCLLSFSVSALKCKARDQWIGWSCRHQFGRLKLIANNNRFLILPGWHIKNLASKTISLCLKRLPDDWVKYFGYKIVLVETFVDPHRFSGTVYKASNWLFIGRTRGFTRKNYGYTKKVGSSKLIFVKPLHKYAKRILSHPFLGDDYKAAGGKMKIKAEHMRSLPDFFKMIADPRRDQGKRHSLTTVLAIAAGAILCGMRGYKAISDWANSLGQKARARFGCRFEKGRYIVPSESSIRNVLIRVDPVSLDKALQKWNEAYEADDESLAIDGKVMCNAIDKDGRQIHVMGVVGHESKCFYTQKKVGTLPVGKDGDKQKQTNEIKVAVPLLSSIDIEDKNITTDALHTQKDLAKYIVEERNAHYFFIAKKNQPTLLSDIELYFQNINTEPEAIDVTYGDHGRIETRKIWTTTQLNEYLNFPHVGQAFAIKREFIDKKTGEIFGEKVYGITSRKPEEACAEKIQSVMRGHWVIENSCHYIVDWNYDEDRCKIRTGYGPENVSRLRKFAVSVIKSKKVYSVAQKMRELSFNPRAVLDYLKMTKKFQPSTT